MSFNYDALVEFVEASGVSREEAEHAIRRCTTAMALAGVATYYSAGVPIAVFMSMTPPTAAAFGAVMAGAGAAGAYKRAPQCAEVREAIRYWSTAPLQ